MGFILSKIFSFFNRSRNNFKVIILGIQNAGKTTILYRLSIGQLIKTTPTIGSNVEEIKYNNVKIQAWDLGGQESTRSVWDVYYLNTDAVIYVIDSKDDSFEESKSQFYKLLSNEMLKNAIILIFANKQDLTGAKEANEIIQMYQLDTIRDHIWHIQPCSAQTGEGLITGIKWLSDQLVFKSNNNFPNNPYIERPSLIENKKIQNEPKNFEENKNKKKENENNVISINLLDSSNLPNNIKNINSKENEFEEINKEIEKKNINIKIEDNNTN